MEKELEYIINYIGLQKTRVGETVAILHTRTGSAAGKMLAPLILMSFVENAFKHGVNPDELSEIRVNISIVGSILLLDVYNKKVRTFAGEEGNGIGIENARERLNLLYMSRHNLLILDRSDSFSVNLTITMA